MNKAFVKNELKQICRMRKKAHSYIKSVKDCVTSFRGKMCYTLRFRPPET